MAKTKLIADLITAGCDVSNDRVEVSIFGWSVGARTPSWLRLLSRRPLATRPVTVVRGDEADCYPAPDRLGRRAARRARGRARSRAARPA